MSAPLRSCIALTLGLLASGTAWAQDTSEPQATEATALPGFELEQLEANPGQGALLMSGGEVMVPGSVRVMALGNYQRQPLSLLLNEQSRLQVVRHKVVGLLSGSYTVLSWLEVGAQLPVVLWQRSADLSAENITSPSSQGLGTPLLHARVGLLSQRAEQPVDLSLDVDLGLPLGSAAALARDDGLRFQSHLVLSGRLGPVRPALEAGVLLRPSTALSISSDTETVGGPEIRVGAALSTVGTRLGAELAARASFPSSSSQASVEVLGGLRFQVQPGLELFALGGPGLGTSAGTPLFRMVTGLSYTWEPPPRFEFLDANPSPPLALADAPTPQASKDAVAQSKPVSTWQLEALSAPPQEPAPEADPQEEGPVVTEALAQGPQPDTSQPFQLGSRERLVLRGTVLFGFASAELPSELPLLDQVAELLRKMPQGAAVIIEGHTDAEGTDTFNRVLSLRRAQAVQRHLVSQGVPRVRLSVRGFGANWPASTNTSEEGRQLNRRVEIFVLADTVPSKSTVASEPIP
jgi:OOP family OmpA-OmpF porin